MGKFVEPGPISGQGARTWADILPTIRGLKLQSPAGCRLHLPPPFPWDGLLSRKGFANYTGEKEGGEAPDSLALNYCFSCKVGGNVLDFTIQL